MAFMPKFLHTLLMIQKDMGWLNSIKAQGEFKALKKSQQIQNQIMPFQEYTSLMDLPLNVLRTRSHLLEESWKSQI